MKINSKILSIPPHISTTWDNVVSISMENENGALQIGLANGTVISIPNLEGNIIQEAFAAHEAYLEKKDTNSISPDSILSNLKGALQQGNMPTSTVDIENLGSFTGMMQHDSTQRDAPDLPSEILDRVSQVAKALGLDKEAFEAVDSEPHCNCPYCQIAKILHGRDPQEGISTDKEEVNELIEDGELKFREWDINQVADKLYEVNNPFEKSEHYQVYLGQPIGCTCGKNNCKHIIAVLNS